ELLTCAVTARSRARDIGSLAELPSGWHRTWRQIQPWLGRLQARAQSFQPIVHYLADARSAPEAQSQLAAPRHHDGETMHLREALLHLLRNAVDHGIEPPAMRVAAGKPAEGRIALCAEISGEYLTLRIEDDGAGLDLNQIRQRALSGGLLSEAELGRISEAEL